jgi:exodeoxyribonuclease VII small subunit
MKNFEDRMARLEELNENLRKGNLPLEESLALFEEGMKLAKGLEKELSRIERKIEILVNEPEISPSGEIEEKPNLELFEQ